MGPSLAGVDRAGSRRACPVCGSTDVGPVVLEERLDPAAMGPLTFASRKTPEFLSFEIRSCLRCSVRYAPWIPSEDLLLHAYHGAEFDSGEEAHLAAETYADALQPVWRRWARRGPAIEVGAGEGSFLPWLAAAGFDPVVGVEPSAQAAGAASPQVRPMIRVGPFEPSDHARGSFAFACCFQTLEHVSHPLDVVSGMFTLLQPGGLAAVVVHDWSAWINRLLGARSPIVDIEHLQLFSQPSLVALAERAGFRVRSIDVLRNRYPLRYWLRISPVPRGLKATLRSGFDLTGLGSWRLGLKVGNLLAVLEKPPDVAAKGVDA